MEECSFHPSISPNSLLMSTSSFRSRSKSPIHNRLYIEGLQDYKKKSQASKVGQSKPNEKSGAQSKNDQKKLTERLVHSKMGMDRLVTKSFEEEFEFKPKIRKDKYYMAAKEKEAAELENISKRNMGLGGRGEGEWRGFSISFCIF